jgi:glycosyltransferase involved in cell wall biosynthesis
MIVKNEQEYLAKCLKSVERIVNEIIIVDTGSSDKTVEIAKSFGAKIFYYQWNNNFSEARNESLKYATKNWILIMDADEELSLESRSKLEEFFKGQLDENSIYYFETCSYYGDFIDNNSVTTNINPRIFKNNMGTHYEGEIHNQLVYSGNKLHTICREIRSYHYGYLEKSVDSKKKRVRNITILSEQIKKDPDNYFAHFNLGTEYAALNDTEAALKHYYKSYEKFEPQNGYSNVLIFRIAFLNYNIKEYDTAIKYIDMGIEHYPKFTELYFLKALIYKDMNMPTLQIELLQKCIELNESPPELRGIFGVGSFKAYYELGNAYFKLRDYDTAYDYYVDAIRIKPDFINPLYYIGCILKIKNTPLDKYKEIVEQFFIDNPKLNSIMANFFYKQGFYKISLDYIDRCEEEAIITDELILLKARCFVMTGDFKGCININDIDIENPDYISLSLYKALSNILTENYDNALSLLNNLNKDDLSDYDNKKMKVYSQLLNLLSKEPASELSQKEDEKEYVEIIIDILEVILVNNKFNELKIAVNLLNLIDNKFVLLDLGKLYYKCGYVEYAKKEIIRSIKEFEVYDREGLEILLN